MAEVHHTTWSGYGKLKKEYPQMGVLLMKVKGYQFPEDLYYNQTHFWAGLAGDLVTIGATDFIQATAGEVLYFQAPVPGETIYQGKPFASLESGKWVGRVYAPISGTIVGVNSVLESKATLINQDPYGKGWLVKVSPTDLGELKNLMRVGSMEFNTWFTAELAKA